MPVMNMFPGGSTLQIPLDAPTALAAKAGNAKVELTWTDPKDKYATPEGEQAQDLQQLVSVYQDRPEGGQRPCRPQRRCGGGVLPGAQRLPGPALCGHRRGKRHHLLLRRLCL